MKGELRILGAQGDTKIIWDTDNDEEVENAQNTFDDLVGKGFAAFRVGRRGDKGEQIKEFQPGAGKLILVPAMAGG